jgi:hypothetical protein
VHLRVRIVIFRRENLLIRSYVAIPLHLEEVAIYPSILLVKPPCPDLSKTVRLRPLNGI